jgi:hypothetical protein
VAGRASAATPAPAPAAAPVVESSWYRQLAEHHGRDHVAVGSVPYVRNQVWVSSRADDGLGTPEYVEFVEGLQPQIEALIARRLPEAEPLAAPSLYADMGDLREVALVFDPKYMQAHVDVLVETIDLIRAYLAEPGHRQFRIGVFEGGLVIYPDVILLGSQRFTAGAQLASVLPAWLTTLKMDERSFD